MDRVEARRRVGLPAAMDKAFIVGNVNRNQQRKRLDLTIEYFAHWVKCFGVRNAYLLLHVAPTGDQDGYDCVQLAHYHGIRDRLIMHEPAARADIGDENVAAIHCAMDVGATTTQGEGWGFMTMEGMACGVPQVTPRWSALGEWCEDAAYLVDCASTVTTAMTINSIGGVPDRDQFVNALDRLYRMEDLRRSYRERGLALVRRPKFRWPAVGGRFADALEERLAELPSPEAEQQQALPLAEEAHA
jgi:glycosyltransferase involved in cell wall biosynthesis